jgi:hypothetical protein
MGQAPFVALGTAYSQDFNGLTGGTDGAAYSWTQNTTLTGWYVDEQLTTASNTCCDDQPILETSIASPNNGGSVYICGDASSDRSLGSRSAGSTGTCRIGVRLVNNTGSAITSLYVDYVGEQWSIAENQTNVNTIEFSYQVGATITSLTAGTWTNAPALNFTQIYTSSQSSGMGGSACGGTSSQCLGLNGNAAANRIRISGCITVSIPVGQEIMLRWTDVNDAANDHHMQIDDVNVWPFDIACAVILPVEWLSVSGEVRNDGNNILWSTATETNNHFFDVERSLDGVNFYQIGRVQGSGNSSQTNRYSLMDYNGTAHGTYYYRIKQVDYNGSFSYSDIVILDRNETLQAQAWYDGNYVTLQLPVDQYSRYELYSADGKLISRGEGSGKVYFPETLAFGIYFVHVHTGAQTKAIRVPVFATY